VSAFLPCLIVGCGYAGSRLARREGPRRDVTSLVRTPASAATLNRLGVRTRALDLDAPVDPPADVAYADLASGAAVVYLVPPPEPGDGDPRLDRFLAQLDAAAARPAVLLYVSTTGVYGDTGGASVDEHSPALPGNDRTRRRLAAEGAVRKWCESRDVRHVILRVPGIYGPGRLPLERLRRGEPALRHEEAGPGNRIHVDDLVTCIVAALDLDTASGVYNVGDGDHASTTEYLQQVAVAAGLPPPTLVSRAEAAARVSPGLMAFLAESRRIDTRRMREELRVQLAYPTMYEGIRASLAEQAGEGAPLEVP
jgi:nucleoside-diphosphate-sugar epimerase